MTYFATQASAQASTNSFADIAASEIFVQEDERAIAVVVNTGADTITFQALARFRQTESDGSVGLSGYVTVPTTSAITVASGAVAILDFDLLAPTAAQIKLQVKSTVADTPGAAAVYGSASPRDQLPADISGAFDPTA